MRSIQPERMFVNWTISVVESKYKFKVLVLYFSISILCHLIFLLHFISEGNVVLFSPLHLTAIDTSDFSA